MNEDFLKERNKDILTDERLKYALRAIAVLGSGCLGNGNQGVLDFLPIRYNQLETLGILGLIPLCLTVSD